MTTSEIRIFVNERGVSVPAGSTALDAVRALFPEDAAGIEEGRLRLTDSRGLPIEASIQPPSGAIFRVVAQREAAQRERAQEESA